MDADKTPFNRLPFQSYFSLILTIKEPEPPEPPEKFQSYFSLILTGRQGKVG